MMNRTKLFLLSASLMCLAPFAAAGTTDKEILKIKETGDMYFTSGNYPAAISQYKMLQDAELTRETWLDVLEKKGIACEAVGDLASAIEAFLGCIEFDGSKWRHHMNLARIYEKSAMNSSAIESYSKVVELKGDKFTACLALGRIYQAQGLNTQAIEYYRQALLIKSTSGLYRNLSKCYELLHDWGMASSMLKQALSLEYNAEDNIRLGMLYYLQGKYVDSIYLLMKESEQYPDRKDIKLHLLAAYFKKGDYESFNDLVNQLKTEYPRDALVYFLSGFYAYMKNDTARAYEDLKKADEYADTPMLKEYSSYFADFLGKNKEIIPKLKK